MDDLLNQIIHKECLSSILISKCRDQVEILLTDVKREELEDLSELSIGDKSTLLGEDAKDVLEVLTLSLRVDLDFGEEVFIVVHLVD